MQELLGHADVRATMIYTHVAADGAASTRSPLDALTARREVPGQAAAPAAAR